MCDNIASGVLSYGARYCSPKVKRMSNGQAFDLNQLMEIKTKASYRHSVSLELMLKENNVQYLKGHGSFNSSDEIMVQLNDGGVQKVHAKNIIIAAGSNDSELPGEPFRIDERTIVSPTFALSLKKVPKRLVVIGANMIGIELARIYQILGSDVHLVGYGDKIEPFADGEVLALLKKTFEGDGIKFLLNHRVTEGITGDSVELILQNNKTKEEKKLEADIVAVAVGRRPYTSQLNVANIGVKLDDEERIITNERFQTSIPNIYAVGDIIGGPMLNHKALAEGMVAVKTIMGIRDYVNYDEIFSVIYTHPEISFIGKKEDELIQDSNFL